MKIRIPAFLTIAIATGLLFSIRGQAKENSSGSLTITVNIKGLKGTEGQALVLLYNNENSWLEISKAAKVIRRNISNSSLSVTFKNLNAGVYGVSVIHDENKNNKMDMRWLPFPKPGEGVGASRNPKPRFGAPSWNDAKFDLGPKDKTITISVRYI
ncbi:MAG: DUF2141 domain-containing protein [Proteobacteria bacterium]|nr:DUF2141 domain-containing protein [Pseudomonadota bacterium]